MLLPPFRTGSGIDIHPLKEGLPLWVGGILIPHTKGAVGHSDADVLLHAICDALLGAANLGDIGVHFPDTDPAFRHIDSKLLLERTGALLGDKGFGIQNIDSTLLAEQPKFRPYIPDMQQAIAQCLHITPEQVSIKATTSEHLGFLGRGEGIAAMANALIFIRS